MRRRSRYGWLELIEGILLILLGIYTLCNPGGMLRGITFAYGFLAVITGISDIVFYAKTERYIGFGPTIALVTGILSLLAGLMLLSKLLRKTKSLGLYFQAVNRIIPGKTKASGEKSCHLPFCMLIATEKLYLYAYLMKLKGNKHILFV